MKVITPNYGLAGGELNASEHLLAAIPKLLTHAERKLCARCELPQILKAADERATERALQRLAEGNA